MRRRTFLAGVAGLGVGAALAPSAHADPQSKPNGPWLQPDQTVQKAALTANSDLGPKLASIAARSKGRMAVEVAGHSASGWPIHLARFGEPTAGKLPVLIQTQIHGGEPLGTEVVLHLMQTLATSSHPAVRDVLERLTIWFIPRLNMDGADFRDATGHLVQRRQNTQLWTPQEWGLDAAVPPPWYLPRSLLQPGRVSGYDINRDFHPDLTFRLAPGDEALLPGASELPGFFVTPEARTSAAVFQRLRPQVFIDHHHRGSNVESETDNTLTTLQVIGLVTEGTPEFPLDPAVRDLSFRINVLVWDTLRSLGQSPFGGITRYPDVELPGTALGSYALNGAGIMLYETRSVAQKSMGMLIQQSLAGMGATIEALAAGSIDAVDPARYFDIPPAGPSIGNPRDDL
ncbi:M14 family zinc carboxypeptidase [Jiangella sp. DSM 45060]|uniref:M14 family zinc carboxypeptidase n=1 Tax=Jiangella sp. DSM 45060 TaxID=1798224 RepID=UPI00087BB245|nr:M14 family zinc carboxypeptidase [Jiangella sp. DSM 45060]SDT62202.1 Zinc carboxypeptidase [Jiangella sp. DSM 45060]